MDAFGIDAAIIIGWSLGVNVAFDFAQRHPQRVAGVLAVAGVPGESFSALFHPLPRALRPGAGRISAHLLRYVGPARPRSSTAYQNHRTGSSLGTGSPRSGSTPGTSRR